MVRDLWTKARCFVGDERLCFSLPPLMNMHDWWWEMVPAISRAILRRWGILWDLSCPVPRSYEDSHCVLLTLTLKWENLAKENVSSELALPLVSTSIFGHSHVSFWVWSWHRGEEQRDFVMSPFPPSMSPSHSENSCVTRARCWEIWVTVLAVFQILAAQSILGWETLGTMPPSLKSLVPRL